MLQEIIVLLLFTFAIGFLAFRFLRRKKAEAGCNKGCGGCYGSEVSGAENIAKGDGVSISPKL